MNYILDNYIHKGKRKKLVEILVQKGIKDKLVLQVIGKIPRHLFLNSAFLEKAYEDIPFQIGEGQTISQPYTVAFQSQLLCIKKGDKILEIGTGSGYQACVLHELGAKVFSIEYQRNLFQKTNLLLEKLKYNRIKTYYGDGSKGLDKFAPYDKIIVTCGAPAILDDLLKQLKIGGILVIPSGDKETQLMYKITKTNDSSYAQEEFGEFKFVPLLGKKGWNN